MNNLDPSQPVDLDTLTPGDILDIDELLSAATSHLAEKTIFIYLRPDLEAQIDALELKLAAITDGSGQVSTNSEVAVGEAATSGSDATAVAEEIQALRREYAASRRGIKVRQLNDEDWPAFEAKWKKALSDGAPYPVEMWNELIVASALAPRLAVEEVKGMRKKLGSPAMRTLEMGCWDLNTRSGASVPFSQLASRALRPKGPATS